MIQAKNISFSYSKKKVLCNIDVTFEKAKLYAIIGTNGSGKTTLLNLISRSVSPNQGTVTLDGKDYSEIKRRDFARLVSLLPQSISTPHMTVFDLVCCGRYPHLDFAKRLTDKDIVAIKQAMKLTDTEKFSEINVKKLSGGERQRAYLAMLLAQDTPYVLLDEPTTHLDIASGFDIMEILSKAKAQGKCVICVLHDLNLAFSFADEVIIICNGGIETKGSPQGVLQSRAIQKVFGVNCNYCDGAYVFQKA